MATRQAERVHVEGHELTITNLDKVLYPETGTTKAQVLDYYAAVAPFLIPAAANRPATRKRWVHGVGTAEEPGEMFFQKNLDPASTPSWVPRVTIKHRHGTNTYPLINNLATLTWLAQIASLELHVPQWQVDAEGRMLPPDRLVLDLDPGPGSGLPECVEVAKLAREILQDMGLDPVPVTSGSKGIHLYVPLDGTQPWEQVSSFARELARSLEADHPDLVVSEQKKSLRHGKVLVDWSQNSGNKTTIVPYSLRGRAHPTVAAPRTWRELLSPSLKHLDYTEVLKRVKQGKDPFSAITGAAGSSAKGGRPPSAADRDGGDPGDGGARSSAKGGHPPSDADRDGGDPGEGGSRSSARGGARTGRERGDVDDDASATQLAASAKGAAAAKGVGAGVDPRLSAYVGKRDVDRTPEPFPASSGAKPQPGDEQPPGGIFVIQEHHARRYHLDLRLEHNGVLASWALPRGVPETPARNNLAVQTEDHPMEYATFAGVIPKGEYGAGTMSIWDSGTFECEKWRDGKEVIATLTGQPGGGLHGIKRFALIHTGGAAPNQWLIHLMKEQPGGRRLSGGTGSSAADATGGTRTTPARTSSAPNTTASTKAAGSPVSSNATPARTSSAPNTTASTKAADSPVLSNATPARTSSAPNTTASTKAADSPVLSNATPARTSSAPSTKAAGSPVLSNATPARTSSAPNTTASTKAAGSPVLSNATPARTSSAPSTKAAGSPREKAGAAAEGRETSPAGAAAAAKAPKPAAAVEPVPIQAPKVTPMLAAAGTAADVRGTDDRQGAWLYELKWDGIRAIITGTRGRIRLMSRNGNEMTATYPELSDASCWPDHDFVADGEIVAVDHSGRPSFGRLQQRMNLVKPGDIERARKLYPVRLMLFDLMFDSGASPADLRDLPLVERRRRLGAFMDRLPPSNCPVHESLVLDHALDDILESAGELGLEGVMAKRADSRYLPGRRSHSWIKLKLERMQEVVVGGWRPGAGVRRGTIGALLVGVPDGDKLRYLGRVGTGFKDWQLKEILERLEQHEQPGSPFHEVPREDAAMARWVEPILVGEVSYGSWTDSDRLRFPVWRGWRPDKEPGEVSVE
ncbi:non-homologous end-joining DNA ligase [Arthrobacter sp. M4]|uniref:non-homologous end-joining DNA ligase n=1 Tax=Arthrobacter sp. M4 TaxID=218160 RepID=UPI001CDC3934|nr:non-homologous end-joining DNA ligase [Arthrobacter sp. M4]MCA4134137.1 non-homologous end-joining DNA ligase [Arthrobacter sp. M4]